MHTSARRTHTKHTYTYIHRATPTHTKHTLKACTHIQSIHTCTQFTHIQSTHTHKHTHKALTHTKHTYPHTASTHIHTHRAQRVALSVTVIAEGNGIGDPSSNPGQICWRFLSCSCHWERHESFSPRLLLWVSSGTD